MPSLPSYATLRLAALCTLFACAATNAGAQGEQLSFAQALERARSRNERILGAAVGVDRAKAERDAARGRRLPDISVSGRATRIDDDIVIDLDPIRSVILKLHPTVPAAAIPPFRAQVQGERFNNLTLNATLPLFAGGRIMAGVRAADGAIEAARQQQRSTNGEIASELAQRYFGLQLAIQNRITRQSMRKSLLQHVTRAQTLERNGQIARAERLRAEVALAESNRELQQATRDERLASLALSNTLSSDSAVVPTTQLFTLGTLAPLDSFQSLASKRNPVLARIAAEKSRAREGVKAALGEMLPSVGVFAQRELYTKDLTLLQPTWAAGIALTFPIFQGGQRLARIESARAQERQVELLRARAQRDIAMLTALRYEQVEQARDQFAALEATRALAQESVRAQQVAFAAGLATSLDVVDAEQALARVQLGLLKAQYDADVALAGLLEAAGVSETLPTYISSEGGR